MPVRKNTVSRCTEIVHGGPWAWNGLTGECITNGWSREQFEAVRDEVDGWYEMFIRNIDFNRVAIEAFSRCVHKGHEHKFGDPLCGESLREALLTDKTYPNWEIYDDEKEQQPYLDLLEIGKTRKRRFIEAGKDTSFWDEL